VKSYWSAWRYIPEDSTVHNHYSENLNSNISVLNLLLLVCTKICQAVHIYSVYPLLYIVLVSNSVSFLKKQILMQNKFCTQQKHKLN
jgi:hypothetical protein